ncbi:D-amino-acid transaminase [Bacillaceae bacterium W0354]
MILLKNDQFLNRESITIDVEDRGFQFGDGVYEVIRIYDGSFFLLDDHLDRLQYSLNEVKIEYDVKEKKLKELLLTLAQKNNIHDGAIYLQISRGVALRSHPFPDEATATLIAYPIPVSSPKEKQKSGVYAILREDIRWLRCDIKSLNLLGSVLAKQEAKENGAFETIQYRDQQNVTEGSSSNVFIVKDGELFTHPNNHFILNGITRRYVHYLAETLSIPYTEKVFSVQELLEADEVFVSSTTAEIVPVTKIEDTVINDGQPGTITTKLLNAFFENINLNKLPEHL